MHDEQETYDSADVFLRKGDYRVKVVVGPYIWWKSFTVDSEPLVLQCDFLRNSTRKLLITTFVYDEISGTNITYKANVSVLYKGKWVPIILVPEEELKSAAVWKIKVDADGYESEIFSLLIDWYQDRLFISSSLRPKAENSQGN